MDFDNNKSSISNVEDLGLLKISNILIDKNDVTIMAYPLILVQSAKFILISDVVIKNSNLAAGAVVVYKAGSQ